MKRNTLLFFAILTLLLLTACGGSKGEQIEWNGLELGSTLPTPKSDIGQILSDSDKHLSIYIYNTSKDDYKDYVSECQSKDFTVESDRSETRYSAYNKAGYKLAIWYDSNNDQLHISLDAPMEMGTLQWPTSELVSYLPTPKSNIGVISTESSDKFFVYVGETPLEDYHAYVDECSASGFSVDYSKGDKFYRANNANGYSLSLNYQGCNVMSIEIEKQEEKAPENEPSANEPEAAPETEETPPANESQPSGNETEELIDGMRPEFKAAMDSYEAFYDEYCDFMSKYNENPTDLELLAKYGVMMAKLVDMDAKFSDWADDDLNDAELKYYLEVTNRIAQKIIDIAN